MRTILLLTLTILLFSCARRTTEEKDIRVDSTAINSAEDHLIAFRRGDSIYSITNERKENLIGVGYFPCLSPDGKKLTYTKFREDGRRVYLLDLQTKQEIVLNVASDNFFDAIWSPDGKYIAFSIMGNDDWEVGIIKSDNTGFQTIKGKPTYGLHAPTWTIDSKSIVAHDLDSLIEFNIDGSIIRQFDIRETIGDSCYVSSDNRFWLTKDREGIFFNSGVNEGMEGVEGPVQAISYYDIPMRKWTRISPTGLYCSDLFMLSDRKIVFTGSKARQASSDVYTYDFVEEKLALVIENGREPSGTKKE